MGGCIPPWKRKTAVIFDKNKLTRILLFCKYNSIKNVDIGNILQKHVDNNIIIVYKNKRMKNIDSGNILSEEVYKNIIIL